jgi:integrase
VFNVVITENELTKANPFRKSSIPGLGEDSNVRGVFDIPQLSTLIHECKSKNDDIRWLLALQIGLGCRHAEVTGLALENLHLNTDLPYVSFEPHPWRSLKTKPSKRNVPLVGVSLWAANKIVELAKQGQDYTFARYTNKSRCNADYSSATLNKWIRSLGIDKTTHELRHTMRDKLRLANAPKSIQDAEGGWGKEDRGDNYGLGYSLEQLKGWLDKVVLK